MPNWCENDLRVSGPEKDLKRFIKQAKATEGKETTPLSMEKFLPTPPEAEDGEGWYNFHIERWGSKWDFCDVELVYRHKGEVCYSYNTAWGPIDKGIGEMARQYPQLSFILDYSESGMGFAGRMEWEKGEQTIDDTWEMRFCQNENCYDELPRGSTKKYCSEECKKEAKKNQ